MNKSKTIRFRATEELNNELKRAAMAQSSTISELIITAINQFLNVATENKIVATKLERIENVATNNSEIVATNINVATKGSSNVATNVDTIRQIGEIWEENGNRYKIGKKGEVRTFDGSVFR